MKWQSSMIVVAIGFLISGGTMPRIAPPDDATYIDDDPSPKIQSADRAGPEKKGDKPVTGVPAQSESGSSAADDRYEKDIYETYHQRDDFVAGFAADTFAKVARMYDPRDDSSLPTEELERWRQVATVACAIGVRVACSKPPTKKEIHEFNLDLRLRAISGAERQKMESGK